jgi:hypothetical protein
LRELVDILAEQAVASNDATFVNSAFKQPAKCF